MTSSAPAKPLVVKDLPDLLAWAPFHEGQVQAFWQEQWKTNARMEVEMERLGEQMAALKSRFVFFCGAASFAGAAVPTVLFLVAGR